MTVEELREALEKLHYLFLSKDYVPAQDMSGYTAEYYVERFDTSEVLEIYLKLTGTYHEYSRDPWFEANCLYSYYKVAVISLERYSRTDFALRVTLINAVEACYADLDEPISECDDEEITEEKRQYFLIQSLEDINKLESIIN